jgi:hypothetical protein
MNGSDGSRPSTSSVRVVADSDRRRHYVPATQSATCQNLNTQGPAVWIVPLLLLTITLLSIFNLYLLMGLR